MPAVCVRPRLDEPAAGIHPTIIDQISAEFSALAKALILTVHLVGQNLPFIVTLAQRILIIRREDIGAEIHLVDIGNKNLVHEFPGR